MDIIFFGTPEYVVPIFEHLLKEKNVVCVVTRSDKPSGRHFHFIPSPIKKIAIEKNIPVITPESLNDRDFITQLSTVNSQLGIVTAYGKILPKEVLDIFPFGCVNLHFSLLPKYRGAAPIQWAIINGESETGVSSFFMDEGLDTGKIIFQKKIEIGRDDDTLSLQKKLIPVAIQVLDETLSKVAIGEKGAAQVGSPTYAPPLKKEDGKINWDKPVNEIYNLIRGTKPWPNAYTAIKNDAMLKLKMKNLKIIDAEILPSFNLSISQSCPAGSIVSIPKNIGFVVKCNPGFLLVKTIQPASKNVMSAWSFLLGHKLAIGEKLY
ncbi:MAG: methionyl-tRNA formyltransferase [Elusimicrobiota bacterium]